MANEEGVIGLSNIVIDNDTVKVIDGPLRNYKGFVVKIDKHKGRARVLFKFNGQDHLIDLSVNKMCIRDRHKCWWTTPT